MTPSSPSSRVSRRYAGPRLALAVPLVVAFALGLSFTTLLDWLGATTGAPAPGAKLDFTATAYCKGTTTASGINVRRGVAAADPAVLPAGSVVSLTTGASEFDGVYAVLDTGPLVRGRTLDLYVWSCHEALAFGRRGVEATVLRLGWDPRASAESLVNRLFRRVTQRTERGARATEAPPPADRDPATSERPETPETPEIPQTPQPDATLPVAPVIDPATTGPESTAQESDQTPP